jgi:hypothetical protein
MYNRPACNPTECLNEARRRSALATDHLKNALPEREAWDEHESEFLKEQRINFEEDQREDEEVDEALKAFLHTYDRS